MNDLIGTRVGNFRVVELLGRGGMGEVYVGYDEKLERKVALKAIRAEHRLDAETKARFLREARVLSQLAHPAICRIFEYIEGDEADFLALELIQGRKLCAPGGRTLDPRERLSLAIELSEALVAAHGKGIVHRDLKPDNVMVDDQGHVKILDFGLARSLGEEETLRLAESVPEPPRLASEAPSPGRVLDVAGPGEPEGGLSEFRTQLGSVVGTLGYMSPEQAHGEPATTASDIFGLGLVLQELFTGQRAYEREGTFQEKLERAMLGRSRPLRGLDPDLTSLIERMKSLAPAARPTAVETVDRLRFVQTKPARRRTRRLVVGALVVLALLSIGATTQAFLIAKERNRANLERDRANEEGERAKKTLEFLTGTFEVSNPRKGQGPSATAKEIIDHAAAKLGETEGQPLLQASLKTTLAEIYGEMGFNDAAEPLARSALQVRESSLGPDHLDVAASLDTLATIWRRQGKLTESEAYATRALSIRERVPGASRVDVAASLNNLAIVWWAQGRLAEAEPLLERSLRMRAAELGPSHPTVAASLNNLATLAADMGKLSEAESLYERGIRVMERALGPNHPDVAASLNNLATIYVDAGKLEEAEPALLRSLRIRERSLGPNHPDVALSLNNVADLHRRRGELDQAQALLTRSLRIKESVLGPSHPDTAFALYNLGVLALQRGERRTALGYMRRAVPRFVGTTYWKALVEDDPDIAPLRRDAEFRAIVDDARRRAADGDR